MMNWGNSFVHSLSFIVYRFQNILPMKKIVTTWLCAAFISTFSSAQFDWAGLGHNVDKYVLTQNEGHIILRDSFFTAVDSAGGFLFETLKPTAVDKPVVMDVLKLLDSTCLYIIGEFTIIGTIYYGTRYGQDWQDELNTVHWYHYYRKGIAFDDTSMIVYDGEFQGYPDLGRVSTDGNTIIWYKDLDGPIVYDLATMDGQIFICTNEGLFALNGDGEIVSQFPGQVFDRIKPLGGTNLLVQRADTLIRMTTVFDVLDTLVITEGNIEAFDAQFGKVGILTNTGQYLVYNEQLVQLENFQLNNPLFDFSHTQIGANSIFLAGNYMTGQGNHQHRAVFAKEYGFDGTDNAILNDLGVENITHGQTVEITNAGVNSFYIEYDSVIISVKNHGERPIKSFYLESALEFSSLSGDFTKIQYKKFTMPSPIPPGATVEVIWEDFYQKFLVEPLDVFSQCMWTFLPDEGIDYNPSNDVGCSDFFVSTENIVLQPAIKVYPNPASHQLFIETGTPLPDGSTWTLYDLYGKAAVHAELSGGTSSYTIDLPSLPTGLYAWHLTDTNGAVTNGKLVIAQ